MSLLAPTDEVMASHCRPNGRNAADGQTRAEVSELLEKWDGYTLLPSHYPPWTIQTLGERCEISQWVWGRAASRPTISCILSGRFCRGIWGELRKFSFKINCWHSLSTKFNSILWTLIQKKSNCLPAVMSNIHSCVVNNDLSFDLTLSRLVTVRRFEDYWYIAYINQSKGRLIYKKGLLLAPFFYRATLC